jgi:Zn-dependent M16 (insulinase) family peptidase
LKKVLIESNLGESLIGGGLSDELLQSTFSVGLKGVKEESVSAVEQLVLSTIASLSETGFEQDAIDAAVNTLEFRLREFNTGGFPRGLSIMLSMLPNWIYDKNPFDGIRFESALSELKRDLAEGKPVFQDLLKNYFISNNHRLTVEAVPDEELEARREKEETSKLEAIKSQLSTQQIDEVLTY